MAKDDDEVQPLTVVRLLNTRKRQSQSSAWDWKLAEEGAFSVCFTNDFHYVQLMVEGDVVLGDVLGNDVPGHLSILIPIIAGAVPLKLNADADRWEPCLFHLLPDNADCRLSGEVLESYNRVLFAASPP